MPNVIAHVALIAGIRFFIGTNRQQSTIQTAFTGQIKLNGRQRLNRGTIFNVRHARTRHAQGRAKERIGRRRGVTCAAFELFYAGDGYANGFARDQRTGQVVVFKPV